MSDVESFYDHHAADEWSRLDKHRTEFAVTLRALRENLPPPPVAILDIGGGPGRYSIALAMQGYLVTLMDLSVNNPEFAEAKAKEKGVSLVSYVRANAVQLSDIADASYEAVLLMGPLYHLIDRVERQQAIAEARRALKPGGVLAVSFITRFAPLRDAAKKYPELVAENSQYAERWLSTGIQDWATSFTTTYFAHPHEVIPFMEACGIC